MWPLAIVGIAIVFIMQLIFGELLYEVRVQSVRAKTDVAALFRSYASAGVQLLNNHSVGVIKSRKMQQALTTLHMTWVNTDAWCDNAASQCLWGGFISGAHVYIFRKNSLSGDNGLLHGTFGELLKWSAEPDQIGFKYGSRLIDGRGKRVESLLARQLPDDVRKFVSDGALVEIL
ncbi:MULTISPECIES: hypothetical protein [unclassified Photorhabdus]|uniref:hypothetical protein n=1 Tax=unclassified Photorhabdus TaxID=2620880 RepID=UPI000DCDCBB5|nr:MULTISPECIES: hypothetical protein [unclassified Photorhabdus]RAX01773.1 hypothetical protein CKY03_04970 [Photorhabdus sp. S9-53]RAX02468.1 hypothetical protein CKY05_04680 [Photorhabdus sp. S10-54]RAX05507.1 hypothetical protein CKY04_04675 [Photorhabdus sp. S8-52]